MQRYGLPLRLLRPTARAGQALPLAGMLLVILLLVAGLVVDAGHLLLARRSIQASADAAAHAGAQQIDVAYLRATGQVRLDATAATSTARALLAAEGLSDADVAAGTGQVEVVVRTSVPVTLVRLSPQVGEAVLIEAYAVGVPRPRATP